MREAVKIKMGRYLEAWWYLRWHSKGFLFGFLPLLFLLAACGGGGGGGGSGGGQGILSVDLAFTPGDRQVKVDLVDKGPLTRLLNISSYQLTAIDSANETVRIEGSRLAEGAFNGSVLRGLTNDHNYTFSLRAFYFPLGSAELANLPLRIDYISANSENIQDAGGITIGTNTDGDFLADSVDADDDNDGLNDMNATSGEELDRCPRGELNWRSNEMTDYDGDGCRDAGEDGDDDNDGANDSMDDCPRGDTDWRSGRTTDNDGDGCRDAGEDKDDDNDMLADTEDLGEYNGRVCRLFADCDRDGTQDISELTGCGQTVDCDGDGARDGVDIDDDGDGLIEIGTAMELDAVRWVLNGSGRRLNETASLNQTGCGNGADRTACNGYELIGDISLAAYAGGKGWAPLGQDMDSGTTDCQGTAFNGVFDGNGFTVRELTINRSQEDCIGLFGQLAGGTVIRNLTVRSAAVVGRTHVGGLVGWAQGAKIVASSSVAGRVRSNNGIVVGGLVGWASTAKIISSSSVAGEVSSQGFHSSGVINADTGGLVGNCDAAEIVSSYSVAGMVESSRSTVGGLVGQGTTVEIVSSYSVTGEVRSSGALGGLVGTDGGSPGNIDSAYWHTAVAVADNGIGEEKTLAELRTPTNDNAYDASGIYADWADGANIDDTAGVENITIYCDEDLSDAIETDEMRDGSVSGENDNRIWDFGGTNDYPAIRCSPLSLMEQRSWWFINSTTNRPQINQGRLDRLTSP